MKFVVYQIQNKETGLCYIGMTNDYNFRKSQHLHHLRYNYHPNHTLQFDYNSGYRFEFTILSKHPTKKQARKIEKEVICRRGHYNIQIGSKDTKKSALSDMKDVIGNNHIGEESKITSTTDLDFTYLPII
jgi:predicted GIY-YIG superfamily endonuclease